MPPSLILKAACLGALALGAGATASAGDWRLDPKLCPDIVKDRLDERVSSARPGKADDINHMRQVNCPASASIPARRSSMSALVAITRCRLRGPARAMSSLPASRSCPAKGFPRPAATVSSHPGGEGPSCRDGPPAWRTIFRRHDGKV